MFSGHAWRLLMPEFVCKNATTNVLMAGRFTLFLKGSVQVCPVCVNLSCARSLCRIDFNTGMRRTNIAALMR